MEVAPFFWIVQENQRNDLCNLGIIPYRRTRHIQKKGGFNWWIIHAPLPPSPSWDFRMVLSLRRRKNHTWVPAATRFGGFLAQTKTGVGGTGPSRRTRKFVYPPWNEQDFKHPEKWEGIGRLLNFYKLLFGGFRGPFSGCNVRDLGR